MLKKLLMIIAVLMPSCMLPIGNLAHATWFQVSTSDSYPPAPPKTWNPREPQGLIAVMSEATDVSFDASYLDEYGRFHTYTHDGTAAAATYGSDTSAGNGVLNPRLAGYSVEPMADTQASAHMQCMRDGEPEFICSSHSMGAYAFATVTHRVIQRGTGVMPSPEAQAIIDTTAAIPLYVDYKLSATASKTEGPHRSYATAEFSMGGLTVIASANPQFVQYSCPPGARCVLDEASERIDFAVAPSTVDRTVSFLIAAKANVSAYVSVQNYYTLGYVTTDAFAQAVADPFVYVDPTWEYAQYFMVQQESLLHPGEWAEVTRIWQQPIPEPETYAMMLAGLVLVVAVARRRKQTQV